MHKLQSKSERENECNKDDTISAEACTGLNGRGEVKMCPKIKK